MSVLMIVQSSLLLTGQVNQQWVDHPMGCGYCRAPVYMLGLQ